MITPLVAADTIRATSSAVMMARPDDAPVAEPVVACTAGASSPFDDLRAEMLAELSQLIRGS